jgi:hypothetical protein
MFIQLGDSQLSISSAIGQKNFPIAAFTKPLVGMIERSQVLPLLGTFERKIAFADLVIFIHGSFGYGARSALIPPFYPSQILDRHSPDATITPTALKFP